MRPLNPSFVSVALLVSGTLAFGCDSAYVISGMIRETTRLEQTAKVTGAISDQTATTVSGVDVTLFARDRTGAFRTMHKTTSGPSGNYSQYVIRSPFGMSKEDFLEFRKPGYETKTVKIVDPPRGDPTVDVRRCTSPEHGRRCWVINVIMTPTERR